MATSQVVGLIKIPIQPGANLITAPLHRIHTYRGVVSSVAADAVTVTGNPSWALDQFGPKDDYAQFILIVRRSNATDPSHEGDWWRILGNAENSVRVAHRSESLSECLRSGDTIEIRHLTSLKDLFGTGTAVLLNKDSDGFASPEQEDLICFLSGTGFSVEVFYHDGKLGQPGYYVNGSGPYDGSTLTLLPDQAIFMFRKPGTPSLSLSVYGQVQMTRLTHYLDPGPNAIGTGFAEAAPLGTSLLYESGWIMDADGFASPEQENLICTVQGTGFDREVFYHDGRLGPRGWYVNSQKDDSFSLEVAKGYFFFIKGPNPLVWRQPVP